jgi:ParB-like chromosome segregation protein Spo0J
VTEIRLADLKPHSRNYNQHSDAQIARIAKSLSTFGQVRSIVVRHNTILAGHGVVLAAKSLGWDTIRADEQDHLTEAQALAYVVADNELARQSDPDQEQLAAILVYLDEHEPLLVEAAGYSAQELQQLFVDLGIHPPLFDPVNESEQGVLSEKNKVRCPECGYEFVP